MARRIEVGYTKRLAYVLEQLGVKAWDKLGPRRFYIPPRIFYLVLYPNVKLYDKKFSAEELWELVKSLDGTYLDMRGSCWVAPDDISVYAVDVLLRLAGRLANMAANPQEIQKVKDAWAKRAERKAQTEVPGNNE